MKKRADSLADKCQKRFPDELSGLNNSSRTVYENICDYIEQHEHQLDCSAQWSLIDFGKARVPALWKRLDKVLEVKTFSHNARQRNHKLQEVSRILCWIDSSEMDWRNKWSDQRSPEDQSRTIKEIGKSAKKLRALITDAPQGYVTEFISQWVKSECRIGVPSSQLSRIARPNLYGALAAHWQRTIIENLFLPREQLLVLLASLENAANQFTPKIMPRSQVGLISRKKDKTVFFVIRLYIELHRILGRSEYGLNADIATVVLGRDVKKARVKEIIERAKKRGEIRPFKTSESPPS